jgi:ATP-dependent exoDNAse (exonuclease V) beta subunit
VVDRVRSIGPGVRLRGRTDWTQLGTAVHAFLAAEPLVTGAGDRQATADRIVARAGLGGALDAGSLLAVSDRLRAVLDQRWPGATWQYEVPITATISTASGPRRIDGVIDLLGWVPDGVILIDHKTYPAPSLRAVAARAAALTPQLGSYADALERCGRPVTGAYLHFPIAGAWVDLRWAPTP